MPSEYEIHPAADIFPMMTAEEFEGLKADILTNGQKDWAVLWEGKIIDGRNRYKACQALGIEIECCELDKCDDPIAYVMSKNLHRRQLTPTQRAMCAAKAKDYYEVKAKERQKRKPDDFVPDNCPEQTGQDARDEAGKAFGVSGKSVDRASHVLDGGCKQLVTLVQSDKVKVSLAERFIKEVPDKKEQAGVLKGATDPAKAIKDYITPPDERKPKAKRTRTPQEANVTDDPPPHEAITEDGAEEPLAAAEDVQDVTPGEFSNFETIKAGLLELWQRTSAEKATFCALAREALDQIQEEYE